MAKRKVKPGDVLRLQMGRQLVIATIDEVRDEKPAAAEGGRRRRGPTTQLALSLRVVDKEGRDLLLE